MGKSITTTSVHIILLIAISAILSVLSPGLLSGQGTAKLYASNPVDISTDFHDRVIAIWGENLSNPNFQVEWNDHLYPASTFRLTYRPQNEITMEIPTHIGLALGIQTLRLYDPASRSYSNPVHLIVSRATGTPLIPLEGESNTVLDHFWGLWGGEEAVLQQNNIYAFVDLFDMEISKYKPTPGARHGLPLMGFEVCSDIVITDQNGADTVVPGHGNTTPSGWIWEGCPNWPSFTHNWWAELYPPESLAAGAYTVKLRAFSDGKYSNSRSLIVLPPDTPPFILSLDKAAVVEYYSSGFPAMNVKGYNLNKATRAIFTGPARTEVAFQATSNEEGSFHIPVNLVAGEYWVHLGDANGPLSNRRPFRIIPNRPEFTGPNITTHMNLNFRDQMYVRHGNPDRWVFPGTLNFVEDTPGKPVPFFWRENTSYIFYNGKRVDGHTLLNPDRGTIEIRGYRPRDWPLGRTRTGTVFNHGYHHIMNFFTQGGDWHSKVRILVRTLYYIPHTTNPASFGYWHIWSHWQDRTISPEGNWPHFEVVMRDDYEKTDTAVVITDPTFAQELADPIGNKIFDIKFVYDFVDRKEGALFIKVRGKDQDYVDRTYGLSRKIAKTGDRVDVTPLVNGGFDFGTEKRHPHRILESSQTAKSGAGGTIDRVIITDQGFVEIPRPVVSITPDMGSFGNLKQLSFKVLVQGSRSAINFRHFDIGYLYIKDNRRDYYSLNYRNIWHTRLVSEGGKEGYEFTLRTWDPFPAARYVISVSGARHRGTWSNQALADFTVVNP